MIYKSAPRVILLKQNSDISNLRSLVMTLSAWRSILSAKNITDSFRASKIKKEYKFVKWKCTSMTKYVHADYVATPVLSGLAKSRKNTSTVFVNRMAE